MQFRRPNDRRNLGDELASVIREQVLSGVLAPGVRVNEVHLARDLGVSRTPLRAALAIVIAEGFISNVPRRGCFVRDLSVEEMQHLYAIRALLDPEALRLAGLPAAPQIEALERLNRAIAKTSARAPARFIALDDEWHRLLLSHCPNPVLLDMIEQHMLRTRRYEHAYARARRHVTVATDEHERIIEALRRADLTGACEALRTNMVSAREPLLEWLRQREGAAATAAGPA